MHKFLGISIVTALVIAIHVLITSVTFPNTYLGQVDVSMKNKKEILTLLQKEEAKILDLQVKDRHYTIPLRNLGVSFNKEETISRLFNNEQRSLPKIYGVFLQSFNRKTTISPSFNFPPEFHERARQFVFDFTEKDDSIVFDNGAKSFSVINHQEQFSLDPLQFQLDILATFGSSNKTITAKLREIPYSPLAATADSFNKQLSQVYNKSVTIAVGPSSNPQTVTLSSDELRGVLGASFSAQEKRAVLSINEQAVQTILKQKEMQGETQDKKVNIDEVTSSLLSLLESRFQGEIIDTITATTKFSPNTDGTVAQKYIEIDISQQRMYLFENGKIFEEHVVSTGLYYPTPTGKFKILNKARNPFSDIYNVFMPYWMAIYYDPKVNAYIGIHELPYWYSGGGIERRPSSFLGRPSSGGCISLDVGIAQKVQQWSEIGMPVHVYN